MGCRGFTIRRVLTKHENNSTSSTSNLQVVDAFENATAALAPFTLPYACEIHLPAQTARFGSSTTKKHSDFHDCYELDEVHSFFNDTVFSVADERICDGDSVVAFNPGGTLFDGTPGHFISPGNNVENCKKHCWANSWDIGENYDWGWACRGFSYNTTSHECLFVNSMKMHDEAYMVEKPELVASTSRCFVVPQYPYSDQIAQVPGLSGSYWVTRDRADHHLTTFTFFLPHVTHMHGITMFAYTRNPIYSNTHKHVGL